MFVLEKNSQTAQEMVLSRYFCTQERGNDGVRKEASITFIKHQNITKYIRMYILTIFERKVIEPSHNMKIIL